MLTLFYLQVSTVLHIPTGVLTALVFGVMTNAFPWFVFFPVEGFGLLDRKAPEGVHLNRISFWNRLIFGTGIALWTIILKTS